MSKKLTFVCAWNSDRRNSWSGTHYSIFCALQKYYDVIDCDVSACSHNFVQKIKQRITHRHSDFGLHDLQRLNQTFQGDPEYPLLQFAEAPSHFNEKQYIYQDLHVGHIKKLFDQSSQLFACSGYSHLSQKAIYNREKFQRAFYLSDYCAGIFTMGKWLAKEMIEEYGLPPEKVHAVGGGYNIDASLIESGRKEGRRFLFIGRDFQRKNGPLVLKAFQLVRKIHPEYELYIAGPRDLQTNIDGVYCLGNLSFEQEVKYFNLCDVFVMPSIFEAYGLVFPEALAFGLPCIGRNAYEMPYFIEDGKTGYLLKGTTADELAALMEQCVSDRVMTENVYKKRDWYLQEYSWDTVAKRISAIIDKNIVKTN